jgi:geranylgeranyl transferase type-2 subunit beta
MAAYLEELTLRLASGIAALPETTRQRHAAYLLAQQRNDGGFAGREGPSDLYYTSFGLRGLAILGELHGERAQRAAAFLRSRLSGHESIVDFLSLIFSAKLLEAAGVDVFAGVGADWQSAVVAALGKLRRPDGGFAKAAEGAASSTYHTFLVLACLELLGQSPADPEKLVAFLRSQSVADGGFLEIRAQKRAGANPTAAAIAALRMLNALDEPTRESTIDFLLSLETDEGGFRANTRIPIADLLSTFTGISTLHDLGAEEEIDTPTVRRFVQSLEREEGGFHGAAWDAAHDVEYTFYGLGCLALTAFGEGPH